MVDTRNKRMSLIGFGSPTPRLLPDADGTLDAADRAMLLYLYPGLSLEAAAAIATIAATVYGPASSASVYGPDSTVSIGAS